MTIDEKIYILQGQINAIKVALGSSGGELPPDLDARLKQVEQDVAELTLEVAAAQNTADDAQQTATSARSAAATAQDTANTADTLAGTAKNAADNALSVADGAIDMAQEASEKADAAQTSAAAANAAADNAQSSAEIANRIAADANRTAQGAQSLAARKQTQLSYLHKIQINFERIEATTATTKAIIFLTGFFTLRSTSPDALSGDYIFDQIIARSSINPITLVGTAQEQSTFAPFVLYQIEKRMMPQLTLVFVGTYFVDGENVEFRVQCKRGALDTTRIVDTVIDFED